VGDPIADGRPANGRPDAGRYGTNSGAAAGPGASPAPAAASAPAPAGGAGPGAGGGRVGGGGTGGGYGGSGYGGGGAGGAGYGGAAEPTGALSDREVEVAALVLEGLTYKQIGERLFISAKTVEHHVARMRQRLGSNSRAELMAHLRMIVNRS
jgi:DNA-binding CsgD family transcriptional regulator